MLKIITLPKYEKKLRQLSKPFDTTLINLPATQKFFDEFTKTMLAADGVGLAAPQIDRPIRVITVNINHQAFILINPKITHKSWLKDIMEEGCLSVPNIYGKVKRHKNITLEYLDRQGKLQKNKFSNLAARIIQHEIDHLDGILFIDKLKYSGGAF